MVTPAQTNRRFLGPGDKLGKFEVIRQIAVGGMAELYLARTLETEGFEKLVCVKRILPQYINNPSFVNMFLNEARLAATLHHPNIVQVYDIGQEEGEYFFAMEYVHGEDLGRLVATARESGVAISLDCALTLVSGLCAGLHHAHERASPEGKPLGVVHRDVSPTNVLVSYDGAVKLVDFGIARAAGAQASAVGGLKGKIPYMSPEQCRGKAALDRRSDVFSIGTILYELTTGRLPFTDETEYGVLQQIVTRDAEPPSAVMPGYPPALEAIVMRSLSRDVAGRFSTALDLQNQLEDYASDNRVRVSPLVVARLMSTLFPARLEEWDHARAQGAFFVEQHVVRTLIESGKTPDGSPRYEPPTTPPPGDDAFIGESQVSPTGAPPGRGSEPSIQTHIGVPPPGPQPRLTPPGPQPRMTPPASQPRLTPPGSQPRMAAPGSQPRLTPPLPHPRLTSAASQPRLTPPGSQPRMPTPPPVAQSQTAAPPAGGAPPMAAPAAGQPRMPTPPPVPGVTPLPGVRYAQMPVPNHPGAVPIVTPLPAPPVPSGGTLVSSALQAGRQSQQMAVPPVLPGSRVAPAPAVPGMSAQAGFVPGPAGDFGQVERSRNLPPFGGHGAPGGQGAMGGMARISAGHPAQTLQDIGDPAAKRPRAANAYPTLVMRAPRRSLVPIVSAAGVGVIGVVVVLVVLARGDQVPPGATRVEPAGAPTAGSAAAPDESATAPPAAPAAPPVPTRAGEPGAGPEPAKAAAAVAPAAAQDTPSVGKPVKVGEPAVAGHEPPRTSEPVAAPPAAPAATPPAATPPAPVAAPAAAPAAASAVVPARPSPAPAQPSPPAAAPPQAVDTAPPSESPGAKKRTIKGTPPDPRGKPAKPRPRRASKPETKEQPWNDDSPFMPVPTSKH